jgi:hypothetical protein
MGACFVCTTKPVCSPRMVVYIPSAASVKSFAFPLCTACVCARAPVQALPMTRKRKRNRCPRPRRRIPASSAATGPRGCGA